MDNFFISVFYVDNLWITSVFYASYPHFYFAAWVILNQALGSFCTKCLGHFEPHIKRMRKRDKKEKMPQGSLKVIHITKKLTKATKKNKITEPFNS